MSIGSGIAIYFVLWWVVLFAVLPWGVRNPYEAGEDLVAGQATGAPVNPNLGRKAIWTTIVSAILFGLYLLNLKFGVITLDMLPGMDLPGMPK